MTAVTAVTAVTAAVTARCAGSLGDVRGKHWEALELSDCSTKEEIKVGAHVPKQTEVLQVRKCVNMIEHVESL